MKKIRVGITGQSGLLDTHVRNFLKTKKDRIDFIYYPRESFSNIEQLTQFVSRCDIIIHIAGMYRGNPEKIYECNTFLAKQLIRSIESSHKQPCVIYISSTQEQRDSAYGRSKREGRILLEQWAQKNSAWLVSLILPSEFGPFGKPNHNSVISTFSYQLTHNILPRIENDAELDLVYTGTVAEKIHEIIINNVSDKVTIVPADKKMKVSAILARLTEFKEEYFDNSIFPKAEDQFTVALFNTFRAYIDQKHYPVIPPCNKDDRGYLIELVKEYSGGQFFFSVTNPGVTRGNHFHTNKIERFCVISGEALIELRRIDTETVISYRISGVPAAFVDIPVFYTHCITNIGDTPLTTVFWTNEIFNPDNPDTFYENVHLV